MTFANEITISDVTSTVSIILVILGGIFGYYQWRKSVLLKSIMAQLSRQKFNIFIMN